MRILGAPYQYLHPTMYLFMAYITNPDLLVCGCRTWISLDIGRFYELFQPCSSSACPACPKPVDRALIVGDRRGRHNLPDSCDSSTACRSCRLSFPLYNCIIENNDLLRFKFCEACVTLDVVIFSTCRAYSNKGYERKLSLT